MEDSSQEEFWKICKLSAVGWEAGWPLILLLHLPASALPQLSQSLLYLFLQKAFLQGPDIAATLPYNPHAHRTAASQNCLIEFIIKCLFSVTLLPTAWVPICRSLINAIAFLLYFLS